MFKFYHNKTCFITVQYYSQPSKWIYPLLYLLLQRHLEVIKLGRIRILNRSEMYTHQVSLDSVLAVFQHRKETLISKRFDMI